VDAITSRHRRRVLHGESRNLSAGAQGPSRTRRARQQDALSDWATIRTTGIHAWIIAAVRTPCAPATDHLDLYRCTARPDGRREETLSALSDLIHSGNVRRGRTSTFPPQRSSRRSGSPSGAASKRFRTSSRVLDHQPEHRTRLLPIVSATGWAHWSGVAGPGACSAADTARPADRHPPVRGMPQHLQRRAQLDVVESSSHSRECRLPMTHLARPSRSPPGRHSRSRAAHHGKLATCWPAPTFTLDDESSSGSTRSLHPLRRRPQRRGLHTAAISSVGLRRRRSAERSAHEQRSTQFVLPPVRAADGSENSAMTRCSGCRDRRVSSIVAQSATTAKLAFASVSRGPTIEYDCSSGSSPERRQRRRRSPAPAFGRAFGKRSRAMWPDHSRPPVRAASTWIAVPVKVAGVLGTSRTRRPAEVSGIATNPRDAGRGSAPSPCSARSARSVDAGSNELTVNAVARTSRANVAGSR